MIDAPLPQSLSVNPKLGSWIRFEDDHTVTLLTGKVEIGQGIGIALLQIAAEELGLPLERFRLLAGDTSGTPDEGWTSASISIEVGGGAVRLVCTEIFHLFAQAAADTLGVKHDAIFLREGMLQANGVDKQVSYWDLLPDVDLESEYAGLGSPKPASDYCLVGTAAPRQDILAKITGAAFIHDIELQGMLHGRVVRPPHHKSKLVSIDRQAIEELDGVVALVVDGSFVGLCAEKEADVVRAAKKVGQFVEWTAVELPEPGPIADVLRALPSEASTVFEKQSPVSEDTEDISLRASYTRPFIAHASIGPACALAQWSDASATIWSHTQGVFPLRNALARTFGLPEEAMTVIHRDGAGCYGHNGADDVALDAALLAHAVKHPVRVVWSREDELSAGPFGGGMLVDVDAIVSATGVVKNWRYDAYSMTHLVRPGWGDGVNLLAAGHIASPLEPSAIVDPALQPFGGGGVRNAIPLYDFPAQEITYHFIKETPIRTSALRSLGAFANVFAIESFIDEVAAEVNRDPVELRIEQLKDPRAIAVVEEAARLANWQKGEEGRGDWGRGIGFAQYKNKSAYFAVVVEVIIDEAVRVDKVYGAVDAGLVINPDGVLNQVEGGIIQSISWALKEQVEWDRQQITTRSWEDYPILGFDEIPEVEITLINRPGEPSRGVGECAAGPVAGAIGNAVYHALGARIRHLPITSDRILSALV